MDVFPPRYGCSCRPSFWKFVRNLGYSQAISDGEMRWLRLHTQPIFISHQCYIYKGIWQPLYAVDVHMDVLPPRYGCSCRPSFLNVDRNMGYSQAISDGEMRWLRLYTQPIFISHQCFIYKGVWQPLYGVDEHMEVFPPRYGCSCRPSFWNFVRNLGYSQAISDGEMRWLSLHTQPIFISHLCYIYKRCLTTFICCGCVYGCVPTTLWLLMPT